MFDLRSLTMVQIERLWNRAYHRLAYGMGYQPYGFDWPTMRVEKPGLYDVFRSCQNEALRRLHS